MARFSLHLGDFLQPSDFFIFQNKYIFGWFEKAFLWQNHIINWIFSNIALSISILEYFSEQGSYLFYNRVGVIPAFLIYQILNI